MVFNRRMALAAGATAAGGIGYLALRGQQKGGRKLPERGTLHRGNMAEPGSLDPVLVIGEQEDNITGDLLTGLMAFGPDARPVPGMAISWTTAPDGLSWTFKLRDALWSDGTPVTADDFVFGWRRLLAPETAAEYAYFMYGLKNAKAVNAGKLPLNALGVRARDSQTLEIDLEHPAPYLLEMLTHMSMYPQPRHVIEAKGKAWTKPGNYVGNGAYLLKEWVPNEYVMLEKNPRFYDAANVAVERIIYYPTDDYAASLKRMRAGELDSQDRIPPEQIDWIKANMPETIDPIPQLVAEYVAVNHKRKPFDDIRVRNALSMAINREMITEKIRKVGDTPAYNIIPPGIANFPGGNSLPFKSWPYSQRISQAQALMRAAGYGPDNRLKTTYMIRSTAAGIYRAAAAATQQMFSLIYVDIAIIPNDFPVFNATTRMHDFDIAELGWVADFNDAETFFNLFRADSGDNWGQYSNPAFDALLNESQQETDLERRGRKLAAAEALLLHDQAIIPLFFWANPSMVWPYVKGWVPNNMDIHRNRWISIDEKARAAQFAE